MKKNKVLWYAIASVLAILIAVFLFLGLYTDRLVDPYVRSLLEETKPAGHNVEYRKIRVNLLSGSISVKDVKIYPADTLSSIKVKYNIDVTSIRLTDFELWEMLLNKSLTIQDFVIENPNVNIILPSKTVDAINEVKERQAPKPKEKLLNNILFDKMIISMGNFKLLRSDTLLASSADINFVAQSINLKRNSQEDPIGFTYGDVVLSIKDIDLYPQSGLYDMKLGKIEARKMDSTIVLEQLKVIPKYDKTEFSKKIDFQNTRFDLNIARIEIADIGLETWLKEGVLKISKVQVDGVDSDIFRDKNVPLNMDFFPPFYNESFLKLKLPLQIDTLLVTNSRIFYNELPPERTEYASITLDDVSAQAYQLSNQIIEGAEVYPMHLFLQAKLMNKGDFDVELILPLTGNLREFECFGYLSSMNAQPLNSMLEPMLNIQFNGGVIDGLDFEFKANDDISKGRMEFLFSELDVALLKKENDKEKGFLSFMANAVAVSNNPIDGKDIKIVEIGFEREKNKGLIGYIWRTIQSGLIRTIVPTNKFKIKEEKENKRKEERQQNRAERKKEKEK